MSPHCPLVPVFTSQQQQTVKSCNRSRCIALSMTDCEVDRMSLYRSDSNKKLVSAKHFEPIHHVRLCDRMCTILSEIVDPGSELHGIGIFLHTFVFIFDSCVSYVMYRISNDCDVIFVMSVCLICWWLVADDDGRTQTHTRLGQIDRTPTELSVRANMLNQSCIVCIFRIGLICITVRLVLIAGFECVSVYRWT